MSNIEKYFNQLANKFDTLPFILKRDIDKELKMLESLIPNIKTESILDIGCGTGRLTVKLKQIGAAAYGIDIANQMIKIAEARYPGIFQTADFYSYKSGTKFDNAISIMGGAFGIIENIKSHIYATKKFFENLNRLLRLNGVAIIEFLNLSSVIRKVSTKDIIEGSFLFQESLVLDPNGFYEKAYSASELEAIAGEFGFDEIEYFTFTENGDLASLQIESTVGLLRMVKKRELINAT